MDIIEIHANPAEGECRIFNYNYGFVDYSDYQPRFGDAAKDFIKDCICDYLDDMAVLEEPREPKN